MNVMTVKVSNPCSNFQRLDLNDHYKSKHPDPKQRGVCVQCFKLVPAHQMKPHYYYQHHYTQSVSPGHIHLKRKIFLENCIFVLPSALA